MVNRQGQLCQVAKCNPPIDRDDCLALGSPNGENRTLRRIDDGVKLIHGVHTQI
jgi:hypothetical protein